MNKPIWNNIYKALFPYANLMDEVVWLRSPKWKKPITGSLAISYVLTFIIISFSSLIFLSPGNYFPWILLGSLFNYALWKWIIDIMRICKYVDKLLFPLSYICSFILICIATFPIYCIATEFYVIKLTYNSELVGMYGIPYAFIYVLYTTIFISNMFYFQFNMRIDNVKDKRKPVSWVTMSCKNCKYHGFIHEFGSSIADKENPKWYELSHEYCLRRCPRCGNFGKLRFHSYGIWALATAILLLAVISLLLISNTIYSIILVFSALLLLWLRKDHLLIFDPVSN